MGQEKGKAKGKNKVKIVSIGDDNEMEKVTDLLNELMAEIGKLSALAHQIERRVDDIEHNMKVIQGNTNDDLIVFDKAEMMAEIACTMVDRMSFDKKIVKKKRVTELQ